MIRKLRYRLRHARALAFHGRLHLREHGWRAAAVKVANWSRRRRPAPVLPAGDMPHYRWPDMPAERFAPADPRSRTGVLRTGPDSPFPVPADWTDLGTVDAALAAVLANRIDILLLDPLPWSDAVRRLLAEAARRAIPVACVADPAAVEPVPFAVPESARAATLDDPNVARFARRRTFAACGFALVTDAAGGRLAHAERVRAVPLPEAGPAHWPAAIARAWQRLHRPRVSIVTILYNKAEELPFVLASYAAQTYPGEIEIVMVDDCSPDDSTGVATAFAARLAADRTLGRTLDFKFLKNPANSGNCVSRNHGIAASTGDVVIVIDADCMVNRDFVRRHVEAHAFDDCEVVIGPLNIETGVTDPEVVLARFEAAPDSALGSAEMQDPVNLASFVNCITRNFSIKRDAIDGPLFDPLFGYSADPASGFGWEDVEMGFRLYQRGCRIKFIADAFSVHVSPPPAPEGRKPVRSLLNFRRLLEKHPELQDVVPAWTRRTFEGIVAWGRKTKVDLAPHEAAVVTLLARSVPRLLLKTGERRLKVLTYRWHVPHQYELWKLPVDVTVATGLGSPMTERWEFGQRPLPPNARFAPIESVDPRDYDVAILHFDENVLAPENTNGVIGPDWGAAFRYFRERIDLPAIAICHGTPQFRGQYDFDYRGADLMQPIEAERRRLVEYLGDIHVVCNSHQAHAEWQFRKSSVIWHGFDPAEFPPATYERGIVSPLGPLVLSRPHYRGYFLYRAVFEGRYEALRPESLRVPEPHVLYRADTNTYAVGKFRKYVDELRRYSVYFNPTLRSPMPRARGEPMMCGVVTVSARNHDVERFIDNGTDGFHAESPQELSDQLQYLMRHPQQVRRMGARSREKALTVFGLDRYLSDWQALLRSLPAGASH